jgi:2-phosphosulfolactate phosphatase
MSGQTSQTNRLDARLVERVEEIPADPPTGNYVVVDVLHFSNTVVELFENGAEYVHITDERGEEFDFRETTPEAVIGGGSTEEYEPATGYDFFNSPSYVQDLDVAGRPVSMTSSNGGRAVAHLRDATTAESEVYVGSTTNAAAIAAHLDDSDAPTYIVSSGSKGSVAVEDHVGATLVSRHLDGIPPADAEREILRRQVEVAKGEDYTERHELRRRDVYDYAMALDSRSVVPHLQGDRLVDVGDRIDPSVANAAASD